MTQWEADDSIGAHRGFFNELEMGHRDNSIYVLHKAATFLSYVPKTLNIDETTLEGKLYAHRIREGFPLSYLADELIGLDKSTLGRFERGRIAKSDTIEKIKLYLRHKRLL
jgi:transposase